jgi:hypothetical protein
MLASAAKASRLPLVESPPSSSADLPSPTAAAKQAADLLTVPVRVNGKGPYRFVVDTGADRTVLATEVGVELGLLHGPRVLLNGVVQTLIADTVSIRHLAFGSIASGNFSVPTVPRSLLDADGYLGLDFLEGRRVTFDFKAGLLQVNDSRPKFSADWTRPSEVRVHTFGSSGHLRSLD